MSDRNRSTTTGYMVDGKYHGTKYAQACARAQFIATEHKRPVEVTLRDGAGREPRLLTCFPRGPSRPAIELGHVSQAYPRGVAS